MIKNIFLPTVLSCSPWSSPVIFLTKKDGSIRFCVDYQRLNDVTKKDSFLLPRTDDILTTLSGYNWFLTVDLKSRYWQVGIDPAGEANTAFTFGSRLRQFNVMRFDLCNALVKNYLVYSYLNNTLVMGQTFDEHLKNLQEFCNRLLGANLKLNFKKNALFPRKELSF